MRHATRFSRRLAVAVAALAALALGFAVGNRAVPVGVAGALAFGWGAGALTADANARRALGSVATVLGGLVTLGGTVGTVDGVAAFVVSALALLGVAAVAVDATAGLSDVSLAPVLAALGGSTATVIAGVGLASVLHVSFGVGVAYLLVAGAANVTLATAFGAFVGLQLQAVLATVLVHRARRTVESWFPGGVPVDAWDELEPLALSVDDVPRTYWLVLGVQVLLLFIPWSVVLVEWLLASTWLFGAAVHAVLTSGVLHALLFGVALVGGTVLVADGVRRSAVSIVGSDPPRSLAFAAGGIAVVTLVPLLVATVAVAGPLLGVPTTSVLVDGVWGASAAILAVVVVLLGVVFAVEVTGVAVAERSLLPERSAGFALGATLLFAAAVLGPAADVPPLVTFAGVAAALVTWDLGETAVDIGSHLGPAAETRRAEVVHATGSLAVGVAGVALASGAVHLVGPVTVPGPGGRAVTALVLALVALLAFALALDRERPAA